MHFRLFLQKMGMSQQDGKWPKFLTRERGRNWTSTSGYPAEERGRRRLEKTRHLFCWHDAVLRARLHKGSDFKRTTYASDVVQ